MNKFNQLQAKTHVPAEHDLRFRFTVNLVTRLGINININLGFFLNNQQH